MKSFLFHGVALLSGLLFGAGMVISQMVNPDKVTGFLDITGNWDVSLFFVISGALVVFMPMYWLVIRRRNSPILSEGFSFSSLKTIDFRLIAGSAIFGIGWGLSGVCPGPALARVSFSNLNLWVFFVSLLVGLSVTQYLVQKVNDKKGQLKLSIIEK